MLEGVSAAAAAVAVVNVHRDISHVFGGSGQIDDCRCVRTLLLDEVLLFGLVWQQLTFADGMMLRYVHGLRDHGRGCQTSSLLDWEHAGEILGLGCGGHDDC